MPLISERGLIDDPWIRATQDADRPASGLVLLPLADILAEGDRLAGAGLDLGIEVPSDTALSVIRPWLARVGLVALRFPAFSDGRGFSLARQLRLEGYSRGLRAVGPLIADQFAFALACGFDHFEIDADVFARQPLDQWLAAAKSMSVSYQRGYGGPLNALDARRHAQRVARRAASGRS
ncbi:MAG: DUF934 domain-containing protein [Alphaproteobacteria bacterium]